MTYEQSEQRDYPCGQLLTSLVQLTKTVPTNASTGQAKSGFPGGGSAHLCDHPARWSLYFSPHCSCTISTGLNYNKNTLFGFFGVGSGKACDTVSNSGYRWRVCNLSWTPSPPPASGTSASSFDNNGNPVEGAAVRMTGTQNRLTVTDAAGNYHFDNVETNGFYTVVPSRANFSFSPSQRAFSQLGQHTDAAFSASPTGGLESSGYD